MKSSLFAALGLLSLQAGHGIYAFRDLAALHQSRGKGGKRAHASSGTRRTQRAATKAKNIQRNRLAHR